MSEVQQQLSAGDRLRLIQTLNVLPCPQFDELLFALNPPKGNIPGNSASQSSRSTALLEWAESPIGPGLPCVEEVLSKVLATYSKTAAQFLAFVISGKISASTATELQAFVELLRKKTGDNSIDIAFFKEGSIKVILHGSPEGLAKLQEMFEAGELDQLDIPPVEAVAPICTNTQDSRKARLIQALKFRGQLSTIRNACTRAHDLSHALDRALDRDRDIASDRALALASAGNLASDLASDLALASAGHLVLDRASDRAQNLDHALDFAIARNLDLVRDLDHALDFASNLASNLSGASDHARNLASNLARAIAKDLDLARARDLDLTRARDLARAIDRDLNLARDLDLSGADLSGANLRDINLRGINLTGADLSYADVTGTIFRDNLGLTKADKQDLQLRGAIFQDPPSSDVTTLVLR